MLILSPITFDDHLRLQAAEKPFRMQAFLVEFPDQAFNDPLLLGIGFVMFGPDSRKQKSAVA